MVEEEAVGLVSKCSDNHNASNIFIIRRLRRLYDCQNFFYLHNTPWWIQSGMYTDSTHVQS